MNKGPIVRISNVVDKADRLVAKALAESEKVPSDLRGFYLDRVWRKIRARMTGEDVADVAVAWLDQRFERASDPGESSMEATK